MSKHQLQLKSLESIRPTSAEQRCDRGPLQQKIHAHLRTLRNGVLKIYQKKVREGTVFFGHSQVFDPDHRSIENLA